jgi:hypothetical protein
MHRRELQLQEQ